MTTETVYDIIGEFEQWALKLPRAELGGLLKEYVAESGHGGWEGYDETSDLPSIAAFLRDMMVYHQNTENQFFVFGQQKTNVNPVE
jgi:hypothetical protein